MFCLSMDRRPINQRVVFDTYSLQNQGGSLSPAGKFSVLTDGSGNLPNPTNVPEGLIVFLTVGAGQPVRIQIPNATSANLSQLVAANNGPASLVTGVEVTGAGSTGISVTNPPLGGVGQSTLNFNGSAIPGITPGTEGQVLIQGPMDPAFYTITGDLACSTSVPGLCTVVGFQGTPVSATAPTTGQTWVFNGTQWVPSSAVSPTDIIANTINPKNLDGTDTIGPFNGIGGTINVGDFGTVGNQTWGLETINVTTNGTGTVTCIGGCGHLRQRPVHCDSQCAGVPELGGDTDSDNISSHLQRSSDRSRQPRDRYWPAGGMHRSLTRSGVASAGTMSSLRSLTYSPMRTEIRFSIPASTATPSAESIPRRIRLL